MGRFLTNSGVVLAVLSLAGLLVSLDDAAMARIIVWIEQTNPYYDGFRIWFSLLILAVFLIWAGRYMTRNHSQGSEISIVWSPVLIGACVLVSPIYILDHKDLLPVSLFAEDGIMETLTVVLLMLSAGFAGAVLWRGVENRADRTLLMAFVAGLLFLAMEEISWGQRIFGIETPEALRTINVQGEINLHNLSVGWNEIIRMVFACLISAVLILLPRDAVPVLKGRFENLKPDTRFLPLIPILIASHVYDEWFEQVTSYLLVSYAFLIYQRAKAARPDQASI